MTDKSVYGEFKRKTERLIKESAAALPEQERLEFLRLAEEVETLYVDLETRNEQLQKVSRQLEASRNEFYELYEHAPVAYVTLSGKGIAERANALARQLLAIDADQLIGCAFSTFVMDEDWGAYFRIIKGVSYDHRSISSELRLLDTKKRPILVLAKALSNFDAERQLVNWRLALIDMTELRSAEARLTQAQEQLEMAARGAELGIWNYDLAKRKSRWNHQLYLLLGLEPRQGPEDGERFFDFIHPEDRTGILKNLQAVVESRKPDLNEEFRVIRADGEIRWLAARGRIFYENGRPERVCGVNFDITKRKQTEEAVKLAQLRLAHQLAETERINEELSQYAHAASHDLKEPLRAVHNYASFLYEDLADSLTGRQLEYLKGMQKAIEQGNRLITDLLAFSRIEGLPLDKQPVDVPDVVAQVCSQVDLPSDAKIDVQPNWPTIRSDRSLLVQILQNLILNAVKFNQSSPKRIEIGWQQAAAKDSIELIVRDNGIGIDTRYANQIFKIFQRLHTKSEFEGTGIGLSIVKKAVQRLGGTVRLESEPGTGSTFFLQLPLEGDDQPRAPEPETYPAERQ
jgi:PAS domain S-box-containing protein